MRGAISLNHTQHLNLKHEAQGFGSVAPALVQRGERPDLIVPSVYCSGALTALNYECMLPSHTATTRHQIECMPLELFAKSRSKLSR